MFFNPRTFGLGFSAAVLLAGCVTAVRPQKIGADQERAAKSLASESRAEITFVNKSGQEVKVYWLDFSGNRKLYKVLKAGESYDQQTYLTHPWLVTDVNGDARNIFFADAQPRVVYIITPSSKLS